MKNKELTPKNKNIVRIMCKKSSKYMKYNAKRQT